MITLTSTAARSNVAPAGKQTRVSDEYYSLVHWLRTVGIASGEAPKLLGVTSCTRGSGVSTVASNLAIAAAQINEQPVLLLDLSGSQRVARAELGRSGDDLLLDSPADPWSSQRVRPTTVANLSVLSVASAAEPPSVALDAGRIHDLLEGLESDFGFVVVDLPAVESSLCFVTAGLLNGVLLVMEAERTRGHVAARAKQRLIDANANLLGVILNKHPQHVPSWLETRL